MGEINFGFLLIPLQLLDMAGPMDLLSNIRHEYIQGFGPPGLAKNAKQINFFHIGPTMEPVSLTGGFKAQPTVTLDDCPKLDYLLVGGPMPEYAHNLPENMKAFIIERSKEVRTMFATCTGGLVIAATGLLDGLNATTNHVCIPDGEKLAPMVKWNTQKNWVVDGKYWTAGGAIAGLDMMAYWVEKEFGTDLLNWSTMVLEYQPRDVDGKPVPFMNGRGEIVN